MEVGLSGEGVSSGSEVRTLDQGWDLGLQGVFSLAGSPAVFLNLCTHTEQVMRTTCS